MRGSVRRGVFAALAIIAVLLAGRAIVAQWLAFRASGASLTPRWTSLFFSAALVLLAYAVLIETWRRTLRALGAGLPFARAARIWFVSNLGRYLPGKVWQIGAMGMMAQQEGVSGVAASATAVVINLVHLLAGFGVVLVTGAEVLEARGTAVGLAAAVLATLVVLPRLVPQLARAAGRLTGRSFTLPPFPAGALWSAAAGCVVAWLLYGVAFRWMVAGILGEAPGSLNSYIAAFTGSYLLGYIALFAPGGIGVREGSLIVALGRFGLAHAGAAGVISIASRLWLTVLEVLPGLAFLLVDVLRGRRRQSASE